jgi:hypothetical protein
MARGAAPLLLLLLIAASALRGGAPLFASARIVKVATAGVDPVVRGAEDGRLPNLPHQFSANVTVVAHLVDQVSG